MLLLQIKLIYWEYNMLFLKNPFKKKDNNHMNYTKSYQSSKSKECDFKKSYSQCGEDMIVNFIAAALGISNFKYLDIGAYHPSKLSNTYYFYKNNYTGVCIEPDPTLFREFLLEREKDICLNIGVSGSEKGVSDFYVFEQKTLNTFSSGEAKRYQNEEGQKLETIVPVELCSLNNIIKQYFSVHPSFISLDIEGMDLEVIRSFDFAAFPVEIFCIETLTFSTNNMEHKVEDISEIMHANGYMTYADTYINTIYVKENIWKNR